MVAMPALVRTDHLRAAVSELPAGWLCAVISHALIDPADAALAVETIRDTATRFAVAARVVDLAAPQARRPICLAALRFERLPLSMEWFPVATRAHLPAWKAIMALLPHAPDEALAALAPRLDAIGSETTRAILRALLAARRRDACTRLNGAESHALIAHLAAAPAVSDRVRGLAAVIDVLTADTRRAALDRMLRETERATYPGARAGAVAALVPPLVRLGDARELSLARAFINETVAPESHWFRAMLFARAPHLVARADLDALLARAADEPEILRALGGRLTPAQRQRVALDVFAQSGGARPALQRFEVVGAALEGVEPPEADALVRYATELVLADDASSTRMKLLALEPLVPFLRSNEVRAVLASLWEPRLAA